MESSECTPWFVLLICTVFALLIKLCLNPWVFSLFPFRFPLPPHQGGVSEQLCGTELPGGVNLYTVEDADKQFSYSLFLLKLKETNRDYLMWQREKVCIRKATNSKRNVLYYVFSLLTKMKIFGSSIDWLLVVKIILTKILMICSVESYVNTSHIPYTW